MIVRLLDGNSFESIEIDQMHRSHQYAPADMGISYADVLHDQKAVVFIIHKRNEFR